MNDAISVLMFWFYAPACRHICYVLWTRFGWDQSTADWSGDSSTHAAIRSPNARVDEWLGGKDVVMPAGRGECQRIAVGGMYRAAIWHR